MTPLDDDSSDPSSQTGPVDPIVVNHVHLIGHVSKPLEIKEMPSGDRLGKWALVVKRSRRIDPADRAGHDASSEDTASRDGANNRRRHSHDTIDCISFDKDLIDRLSGLSPRTRLEVHGALRRRFYPGQDGRQSSYAVEAVAVAVLSIPADNVVPDQSPDSADVPESRGEAETVTAAG